MAWMWLGFLLLIAGLLALDLGVFHRRDHVVGTREALAWTGIWIALALVFNVFVYFAHANHWLTPGTGNEEPLGGPRLPAQPSGEAPREVS